MKPSIAVSLVATVLAGSALAQPTTWKWSPPYQDDPAIVAKLSALGEGESAWIGEARVEGLPPAWAKVSWLAKGPFTRGFSRKMPYAPDRKTAFYAGQDHNLPHFNDAWEYHLGSNTWHCLAPPDGGNTLHPWRRWPQQLKKEKDPAKRQALEEKMARWMQNNVKFENGYVQTKVNDGPALAFHTWDGITYDPRTGRMYWAVLDNDERNAWYLKVWSRYTGRDFETEKAKLRPGTGLWNFDPQTRKWSRWLGDMPHARMYGMGAFLHYIPSIGKMIWYACSQNVTPHEYAQWSYDAATDAWEEMKPNGGKGIATLCKTEKVSPPAEMQVAYSASHDKLVAVADEGTWIYDVAANRWSRGADGVGNKAHDNRTVFDYDSVGDVFLLYDPVSRRLSAYSLERDRWEVISPKGAGHFDAGKYPKAKGFYDPEHNVFVLTNQGNVWVYRHKRRPG